MKKKTISYNYKTIRDKINLRALEAGISLETYTNDDDLIWEL